MKENGDFEISSNVQKEELEVGEQDTQGGAVYSHFKDSRDAEVLTRLANFTNGSPLLLERLKQDIQACKEVRDFLRRRAALEDEYARNLQRLAKSTLDGYTSLSLADAKQGTFGTAWRTLLEAHYDVANHRLNFAAELHEMTEDLHVLHRESEKGRRALKDDNSRNEKTIGDSDLALEKAKQKYEENTADLERILLMKNGEPTKGKRNLGKAMSKPGLLFKNPKDPQVLVRAEEEARLRIAETSSTYNQQHSANVGARKDFHGLRLPRTIKNIKDLSNELEEHVQYHLTRFLVLWESSVVEDGLSLSPFPPPQGPGGGLRRVFEKIDPQKDFQEFMENFLREYDASVWSQHQKHPSDLALQPPQESQSLLSVESNTEHRAHSRGTFGVPLEVQNIRDSVEVPKIIEKCTRVIESYGLDSQGLYRLSGTTSRIAKLKQILDTDPDSIDLNSEEFSGDINDITGVLKLWFRELPEPLFTNDLYGGFIDAAKIDNERLRHIRLHERVNELPDPNYSAVKFFLGHLARVKEHHANNQMSSSNIAIVMGPTLLGSRNHSSALQDMNWQCRAIETIIDHYSEIFVAGD